MLTELQNVAVAARLRCSVVSTRNAGFVVGIQRKWPQLMVTVRVLLRLTAKRWLIAVEATQNSTM